MRRALVPMRRAAAAGLALALATGGAQAAMSPEPIAILQGLDKITARVSRFDAPVGHAATFGDLSIVVRDCEKSAPEDQPENAAFLQIYESRPGEPPVRRFSGWMFSSSPALSAMEHPVYDVNLLACKAASGSPAAPPASGKSRGNTAR